MKVKLFTFILLLCSCCSVNAQHVVSVLPFVKHSKVNAIAVDGDTAYVGGIPGRELYAVASDADGKLSYAGVSEPFVSATSGIKDIKVVGDYLYVCSRDNGYGMTKDYRFPTFLAPFEDAPCFEAKEETGSVSSEITAEPCPSRWCKSLHLYKGAGRGSLVYSHKVPPAENSAEFILWLKVNKQKTLDIPLLKNLLSIAIGSKGHMGLKVKGKDHHDGFVATKEWMNIKVIASAGCVSLYVRDLECPEQWTCVCKAPISDFHYDQVSLGMESWEDADILIDDYAYSLHGIEESSYINGALTVIHKHTLRVICQYKLEMRCLSMYKDGHTLYLGMIGGINVYDLSHPAHPHLIGVFRDPVNRYWDYPARGDASYSYRVPGQEFQRMDMMQMPDGRKILVGGSDTHGVTMIDVSNPRKPLLHKHLHTTPRVAIKESAGGKPKYIEWGIYCHYPYIYSTVASLHSLVHNEYYSGKFTPVSYTPDVYGLKVYDISDIHAVKDTLILVPSEYFPTHIAQEGDSSPNHISRIGNRLYLNFSQHGVAAFRAAGFASTFEEMLKMPYSGRVRITAPMSDGLIVGDGAVHGPWTDCNIYSLYLK